MSTRKLFRRVIRRLGFLLLLLASPLLTACEDEGMAELFLEMAVEWADEKDLISVADDGELSLNYGQLAVYEGKRWWNGTSGDGQVDAALEAGPIAHGIYKADQLAEEGIEKNDPAKLDEAIALRPDDWSYRDQKGALLAARGDEAGAQEEMAAANALVEERINDGGSCRGLKQNLLRNREAALSRQLQNDPENEALMGHLMDTQDQLYALQNNLEESPCP